MEKAEGTHGELGAQAELTPVLVISPSRSPSSLNCQILVLRHRRGRVTGMDGVTRHGLRLRHTLRAQRGQKLPLPSHRRDHYAASWLQNPFSRQGREPNLYKKERLHLSVTSLQALLLGRRGYAHSAPASKTAQTNFVRQLEGGKP